MFLGSKFCGHCGARAAQTNIVDKPAGDCPRCKKALEALRIGATDLSECTTCGGFWVGVDTFESICADKEEQSAVISHIRDKDREVRSAVPVAYVPCPDCKQLMNRSNFARSSGVIIDLCKQHGVWFDSDELPRIIEFIEKGGLARSREKERIELEDERDRLRDERRRMSTMETRSGVPGFTEERASGFGRAISALFDL